jgi:hypothetical protein
MNIQNASLPAGLVLNNMLLHTQQFGQRPNVVGNPRFHRRGDAKRRMHPHHVVVCEVQGDSGFQVRELLAVGVRQACQAAKLHPHRKVTALNIAGRNVLRVGSPDGPWI